MRYFMNYKTTFEMHLSYNKRSSSLLNLSLLEFQNREKTNLNKKVEKL